MILIIFIIYPEPVREHAAPLALRRQPLRGEQQRQDARRHRQGARPPPLRRNGELSNTGKFIRAARFHSHDKQKSIRWVTAFSCVFVGLLG